VSAQPTVVVDTDVFSRLFVTRDSRDARVVGWRRSLTGVRVVIATQTLAEVLAGAMAPGWGVCDWLPFGSNWPALRPCLWTTLSLRRLLISSPSAFEPGTRCTRRPMWATAGSRLRPSPLICPCSPGTAPSGVRLG